MKKPQDNEYVAYCLELLSSLGPCNARSMFGGYGIYLDGLMFALIAADRLYLKADADSEAQWRSAAGEPFVYQSPKGPMAMSYWTPPQEAMDSPAQMAPWARLGLEAALRARAAKPAKKSAVKRAAPRSKSKS
ncbi:MAG TPA: TfoX/Sxy family protein [Methylibium sp.]